MAQSIGSLALQLTANSAGLAGDLNRSMVLVQSFAANSIRTLATVGGAMLGSISKGDIFGALNLLPGVGNLAASLESLGAPLVRSAAMAETAVLRFTELTGSAEKAASALGDLKKLSLESGFGMSQLEPASRSLVQAGVSADFLAPTMRSLATLAAATGQEVDTLAERMAKVVETGRVTERDLRVLGGPVLEQLAKNAGVARGELRRLGEEGQIGPKELLKAIGDLTQDGGRFSDALEKRANTLAGAWDIAGVRLKTITGSLSKAMVGGFTEGVGGPGAALASFTGMIDRINSGIATLRPGFVQLGIWAVMAAQLSQVVFGVAWGWIESGAMKLFTGIGNTIDALNPFFTRLQNWAIGFGIVAFAAIGWVVDAFGALNQVGNLGLTDLINNNADLIIGITAGVLVVKGLIFAYGALAAMAAFLRLGDIASIAIWLTKIAVIGVAKIAMLLFNAQYFVYAGLIALATGATAGNSAAILIATAASWLWNSALTVTNALLLGAGLLSAVATIAAISGAVLGLVSLTMSLVSGVKGLVTGFGSLSAANSPIGHITDLFGQWKGIVTDVIALMKTDMPSAMKLASAGFEVAFTQMRAFLPPLWEYIAQGFEHVLTFITRRMAVAWRRMKVEVSESMDLLPNTKEGNERLARVRASWAKENKDSLEDLKTGLAGMAFNNPAVFTLQDAKSQRAMENDPWSKKRGVTYPSIGDPGAQSAMLKYYDADQEIRLLTLWRQVQSKNWILRDRSNDATAKMPFNLPDGIEDTMGGKHQENKLAGADLYGSKEAASVIAQYQSGQMLNRPEDRQVEVLTQIREGQKRTNDVLDAVKMVLTGARMPGVLTIP